MTPQLQSAFDMLNACPDADAVADLLRRHGIKGTGNVHCNCPLYVFFRDVGGMKNPSIGLSKFGEDEGEHDQWLPAAAAVFSKDVYFGCHRYADLITEAT